MSNNSLKPINNEICAYRDCTKKSQVRLNFALGFSALFCQKCAKILLADRLATAGASDYEKEIYLDGVYDTD
jgi:hypothetical protein